MRLHSLIESTSEMIMFHGYTGDVVDIPTPPIHFAYDEKLSSLYGNGKVEKYLIKLSNPLVISSDKDFRDLWTNAGLEEPEDFATMPELKQRQDYIVSKGYDGVIFKEGIWDASSLFQNTFGDEQVIVFDASKVGLIK